MDPMRTIALVLLLSIGWPLAASGQETMSHRWHRARVLYAVGSVTGLVGSALTLSSVLVVAFTGYPCTEPNPDPLQALSGNACPINNGMVAQPKPTDAAPLMAYLGSSVSAVGFVLSASALGYQHYLLDELHVDPGRGTFAAGTAIGLMGFVSVGASYFFGFTNYL